MSPSLSPDGLLRRRRQLPQLGEVLVAQGDVVEPLDVVARTTQSGGLALLNVSRELGAGARPADAFLAGKPGQMLLRGETLARRRFFLGLRERKVTAPGDARLLSSYGPWVYLARSPSMVEVLAGYRGRVVEVHQGWGVVLEIRGALLQGVWGGGGESIGVLRLLGPHPEESVGPERVDERCRGAIAVAGAGVSARALGRLEDVGARGLIAGSLSLDSFPLCSSVSFPVLITEGVGAWSMARPAWELLEGLQGREASLVGRPVNAWEDEWPEVFVPGTGEHAPAEPAVTGLAAGQRVRVARDPHAGRVGWIESLAAWPQPIESGARLEVAVVALEGGGRAAIPLANLEPI